jgi:4-amino-4-deoxy-L-arabinose transferase-like glycosyltransferase
MAAEQTSRALATLESRIMLRLRLTMAAAGMELANRHFAPALRSLLTRRIPLPLTSWPLAVLVVAFVFSGLVGHDPWKTEDAVGFGVAYQMLTSGDWLLPKLAGEPFYEDGPLYFWVAALAVNLLGGVLADHDAARFASAFFILATLWCVRLAGRELYGRAQGDLSMLALMGSLGLLWHAHEAAAESAMLAGLAAAYYAVAISHRKPYKGAFFFGLGTGVVFLAKGIVALIQPFAAAALVLPLSAPFRQRRFAIAVGLGVVVAMPFILVWPWLIAQHAPQYYEGWMSWQLANLKPTPSGAEFRDAIKTLAWAAWPVWPMTLWATWEYRRQLREPGFAVPLVASIVSFAMLLSMANPGELDALALLVPLSIPAGAAAMALRRGAANALAWFAMMTFSLAAIYMWLMWLATLTGFPERLARTATRLEPGFVLEVHPLQLVIAIALTAAWGVLCLRAEHSTLRSVTHWAAGMTLIWGLASTLWLDWIDYGKSYRPVAMSLRKVLPAGGRCIESQGLGVTQRAALHYHAGLTTRPKELYGTTECPYLLVQSNIRQQATDPGPEWIQLWEGNRPRDRERYRLYRRTTTG